MSRYCGWDEYDFDEIALIHRAEITLGKSVTCAECGKTLKKGELVTGWVFSAGDIDSFGSCDWGAEEIVPTLAAEPGTFDDASFYYTCEPCTDLYDSLKEAGHEPHFGYARKCAAEAAALRKFQPRIEHLHRNPNAVCVQCRFFDADKDKCAHKDPDDLELGETTLTENRACSELPDMFRPWIKLGFWSAHFCCYWEA